MQRLTMYRLRAKVAIEETDLAVARGTGPAPEGALTDPRHPALGWRLYGAEAATTAPTGTRCGSRIWCPRAGIELTPESYILEAGFERLHGVDFRKGCYVGQEVTARMKHKTELRKGLAQVAVEGPAEPGTPIEAGDREAGTLLTPGGRPGHRLAALRPGRGRDAGGRGDGQADLKIGRKICGDRVPCGLGAGDQERASRLARAVGPAVEQARRSRPRVPRSARRRGGPRVSARPTGNSA